MHEEPEKGMGLALPSEGRGFNDSQIALAAAAVFQGVAVEDFPPEAKAKGSDAIIVARHRGEIKDGQDDFMDGGAAAQERNDALLSRG